MPDVKVGIVGPCAAGKSTLKMGLKKHGYSVRHIAQEHSYVPDMWRRISDPDILIYLDVSYETSMQRRKLNWTEEEFEKQLHRLRNARKEADLYIETDNLTTDQVLDIALEYLSHLDHPNSNKIIQS